MNSIQDFPDHFWKSLETHLSLDQKKNPTPAAAFDADGTLWATDLGEAFFKFQIQRNLLPEVLSKYPDPWRHYRDWKESGDPRPAYLWLAQINAGRPISEIRAWAAENVRSLHPLPFFAAQQKLIRWLQKHDVRVFVVTASVAWAVEPGALLYDISQDHVIGVKTQVLNGVIQSQPDGEMTYREGKMKALLQATGGQAPFFASGNTLGDCHLLEGASLRLAVTSTRPSDELYKSEQALQEKIKAEKLSDPTWFTHAF